MVSRIPSKFCAILAVGVLVDDGKNGIVIVVIFIVALTCAGGFDFVQAEIGSFAATRKWNVCGATLGDRKVLADRIALLMPVCGRDHLAPRDQDWLDSQL